MIDFINGFYFNLFIVFLAFSFAYYSISLIYWYTLGALFFSQLSLIFLFIYLFIGLFFVIPNLRINIITKFIVFILRKFNLSPKISKTEKTVLLSGNSWIDKKIFSASIDFEYIKKYNYSVLSSEEKRFLENEVEELCKLCNNEEVYKNKDLSNKTWKFLKEKKFFGIIIPKKYDGLEFSALAHSLIIQKLSSRNIPLAITTMVPNSLGPAELILHYGTENQKNRYLSQLANGREVPCFGLTEPFAGSDADAITSNGKIFKDKNGELKILLNFNKRYITLGAVASLIGLAFKLYDPENLLGEETDLGITCALVKSKLSGIKIDRRHDPLSTPFINSPISGKDVIIEIDNIIGGKDGIGKGWQMLMECLSAGRGISLPSTSSGGSKFVTRVITAYSSVRKQFNLPICKFQGVEKVLAKIIRRTYEIDALNSLTLSAIDNNIKPSVISAIAKYYSTESFRKTINDAMDIAGGSGIIRGPRNLLANAYFSAPISITVEGSNILTRNLIIYGQGVMMCHPYIYQEISALENNDLKSFDHNFFSHIKHLFKIKVHFYLLNLTRGYASYFRKEKFNLHKYYRKLHWSTVTFAFLSEIAIFCYRGGIKKQEKINARFADILSNIYIGISVIKKFLNDEKYHHDLFCLMKYTVDNLLYQIQISFEEILQNLMHDKKYLYPFLYPIYLLVKLNKISSKPLDELENKIVTKFLDNHDIREYLTDNIYIPSDKNEQFTKLEKAFSLLRAYNEIISKIKKEIKDKLSETELIKTAIKNQLINKEDISIVNEFQFLLSEVTQVDDYPYK